MLKFCAPFPMFPADHVLALAPVAEASGFHVIAVPDSVFFPEEVTADYPYSDDGKRFWPADTPFVEPFVAMAAMAAITSSIRFVTNVLKTPLRDPLIIAKQLSSLSVLSGERVELGVGLSWIPEEFTWTKTEMRTRGSRLDEQIEVLRTLCGGGGAQFVEHHGKHYDFGRLMMSPAPQEPVRIHVGGHSDPGLKRAARVGDGWISVQATSEEIVRVADELQRLRSEYGRTEVPFDMNVLPIDVFDLDGYKRLGAQIIERDMQPIFQVVPWYFYGGDPNALDIRRAALERFGAEIIDNAGF